MRLLRDTEVLDGASYVTFRTSRLGSFLVALVFTAAVGAFALLLVRVGRELPGWGWVLFVPLALALVGLAWLIAGAVWNAVYASLLSSNWSMKVGQGGVWLHLRSFQNHAFEEADETAAFLGFDELQAARKVVERRPTGMSGAAEVHVATLELVVDSALTTRLAAALQRERLREGPRRSFLGITSRTRSLHVPVFVARPGHLRVQWHGGRMLRVLRENGVEIRTKARVRVGQVGVEPGQVDDEIVALIERGEKLHAIALVRRSYGMGLAEAKAFVEDLGEREAA